MLSDRYAHKSSLKWYKDPNTRKWLQEHPDIAADLTISLAYAKGGKKNPFDGEMPEEYMDQVPESAEGKNSISPIKGQVSSLASIGQTS